MHYRDAMQEGRLRSILRQAELDRSRASVLLMHAPNLLPILEEEGISLQLCGHTHAGQLFPFNWIVSRLYGMFAYGLNRLGNLTVYTSSGAGTRGPPTRIGSKPEVVLISFE